ncbi:hypothetical protein NW752_011802 [Fusarium irregulare]|nr:hypothetical protein NW752_011802 [Fusarium irregulare]
MQQDNVVNASVKTTRDANGKSDQSNQSEDDGTDIESSGSNNDRIEEYPVSLDDTSDFGVSDVEKYIQENSDVWENPPDPADWFTIRCCGIARKPWPKDMAIEAAFHDFKMKNAPIDVETRRILKDTPGTRLLRSVIVYIARHYDDLEEKKRVAEKRGGKALKYNTFVSNSNLVRNTKEACEKACKAYRASRETAGGTDAPWEHLLPPHAQVLACGYVGKDHRFNGIIARDLVWVDQARLLQITKEDMAEE